MKKVLISLLLCLCLLPLPVMAETETSSQTLSPGWNLIVNGQIVTLENGLLVEQDRALASAQALCDALGVPYSYEDGIFTIGTIVYTCGEATCTIGEQTVEMEIAPREVAGTFYVPVRFFAEQLNCQVDFKEEFNEDGTVYASVVFVQALPVYSMRILVPGDNQNLHHILQIASALSETYVELVPSVAEQHTEWCRVSLSGGDSTVIYDTGELAVSGIADGLLANLSPYLATLAPDVAALIENDKEIQKLVTNAEGNIIAFPIPFGETTELFYVPQTVEGVEHAVTFLNAYYQVVKALMIA
ncbi:MAG: hypothetical protein E7393_04195 [Ruminococcaceae bacterium]|nr:hypothetical protein [Oscillospiraceae bacterium]